MTHLAVPHPLLDDPAALHGLVTELGERWEVSDLAATTRVVVSRRLTTNLGNARPAEGRIAVADRLRGCDDALVREVVAHEAAHVAVHRLHGSRPRPHGPEWAALMVAAALPARATLPADLAPAPSRPRARWRHRCRSCGATRDAGRPMRRWRCTRCLGGVRRGRVEVVRLDPGRPAAR